MVQGVFEKTTSASHQGVLSSDQQQALAGFFFLFAQMLFTSCSQEKEICSQSATWSQSSLGCVNPVIHMDTSFKKQKCGLEEGIPLRGKRFRFRSWSHPKAAMGH